MNRDLKHQELAMLLNHRAQVKAENERMKELESHATPLFVVFIIAVILLVLGMSLTKYVNAQTESAEESNRMLAACMNGRAILVDGAIMRCSIVKHNLVESLKK